MSFSGRSSNFSAYEVVGRSPLRTDEHQKESLRLIIHTFAGMEFGMKLSVWVRGETCFRVCRARLPYAFCRCHCHGLISLITWYCDAIENEKYKNGPRSAEDLIFGMFSCVGFASLEAYDSLCF